MQGSKWTLKRQKTKRRSMTPDYEAIHEQQDAELSRELGKTVTFGSEFISDYEQALKQGEMNLKIKLGIERIIAEQGES